MFFNQINVNISLTITYSKQKRGRKTPHTYDKNVLIYFFVLSKSKYFCYGFEKKCKTFDLKEEKNVICLLKLFNREYT